MRRVFLILTLVLCAPLRAGERFLIERIEVRNLAHASRDVIVSESRLREQESYDEDALRAASDRIKRLPFVLDASFSLERGSVRDAYVLVVNVTEARPVFYQFDTVPFFHNRNELGSIDDDAFVGVRMFAGRSSVFHLAAIAHQDTRPFESSFLALQAGYTQYGLFNNRAFASFTINQYAQQTKGAKSGMLPGGLIGVSLTPNQTLTVSYTGIEGDFHRRSLRILETRLSYNTTNHPYFPSQGSLVSVAPIAAWVDGIDRSKQRFAFHTFETAFEAKAARYWTINDRVTASMAAEGGVVHIDGREHGGTYTLNTHYGTATVRLLRAIGDTNADSDRRIELMLRGVTRHQDQIALLGDSFTQASVSWVRRNSWGFLRLGLGYAW